MDLPARNSRDLVNYLIIRIESSDCDPDLTVHYKSPSCLEATLPDSPTPADLDSHRGFREFQDLTILTFSGFHLAELIRMSSNMEGESKKDFFCGNPVTETTHGIMHLYKEPGLPGDENERPRMLCMMAVPACLTLKDLTQFLSHYSKSILEIKIIRDISPNQYMVLLLFDTPSSADEFFNSHNNSRFNLVEPHVCALAFVSRVETVKSSLGACFPIRGSVELPICPVCLEKLEEPLDGVLTIMCNHSYHLKCLDNWEDSSGTCPVCRFLQTPQATDGTSCTVCGMEEDLWICLLCGHVGCGRYAQGHAIDHFNETSHTFALEVGKNGVWDYVEDAFVHRLVQNKGDGKIVQVTPEYDDCDEKMDSVTMEFTYLLTSQLESQRLYYEEQLKQQDRAFREALDTNMSMDEDKKRLLKQLQDVKNEKLNLEKKLQVMNSRLQKLQRELDEERGFNTSLRSNQKEWQQKLSSMKEKYEDDLRIRDHNIKDLEEQLQDLVFHMEAKSHLKSELTSDELQQNHIIIGEASGSSPSTTKPKRKSKR